MPTITALPFFAYPVSDMARARSFYADVLGLVEVANWDDQWVEFGLKADDPGAVIALARMMADGKPIHSGGGVALETTDFDEWVGRLKEHGVTFELEPMDSPVCRFALFLDPDGNRLVLHRKHV